MLDAKEQTEMTRLASLVQWLEGEQKQDRSLLGELRHLAERLSVASQEQGERMRVSEATLAELSLRLQRLARLEEELSQLREMAGRLQIGQVELSERLDQADRERQAEGDRGRQARVELWERLEALGREGEDLRAKQAVGEEMGRRQQELLLQLQAQVEELRDQGPNWEGKLRRTEEANRRAEGELQRLGRELEGLQKQDEVILGRFPALSEHLRQLDERQTLLVSGEEVHHELRSGLELLRAEQQRFLKGLSDLEQRLDGQFSRLEEQGRRLGQAESKSQAVLERMEVLLQEFEEHQRQMAQLLASYVETDEQLKRRQVTELEQQVQELRRRVVRLKGG